MYDLSTEFYVKFFTPFGFVGMGYAICRNRAKGFWVRLGDCVKVFSPLGLFLIKMIRNHAL